MQHGSQSALFTSAELGLQHHEGAAAKVKQEGVRGKSMLRKSFLHRVTKLASAGGICLAKTLSVCAVRLADRFGCRVAGSASVLGLTRAQQEVPLRLQLATARTHWSLPVKLGSTKNPLSRTSSERSMATTTASTLPVRTSLDESTAGLLNTHSIELSPTGELISGAPSPPAICWCACLCPRATAGPDTRGDTA